MQKFSASCAAILKNKYKILNYQASFQNKLSYKSCKFSVQVHKIYDNC